MKELKTVWKHYFFMLPGLPLIGNLENTKVVVAHGFGRNGYPENELGEICKIRNDSSSDCEAAKKLTDKGFDAGYVNYKIAQAVLEHMTIRQDIIAILQWEIGVKIYQLKGILRDKCLLDRITLVWPPGSGKFNTRSLILEVLKISKERNLNLDNVAIIAHRDLLPRSFLVTKRVIGLPIVTIPDDIYQYDNRSVQIWTRNRKIFLVYEFLARVHHILFRWV